MKEKSHSDTKPKPPGQINNKILWHKTKQKKGFLENGEIKSDDIERLLIKSSP